MARESRMTMPRIICPPSSPPVVQSLSNRQVASPSKAHYQSMA